MTNCCAEGASGPVAPNILLTVVIPTFGRPDLFEETLASLKTQTLSEFVVIVTDNSVKDDDRRVIRSRLESYQQETGRPTRYIFTQPDLGMAANANQGLAAVETQFARILHSDDLISAECLQTEVELLTDPTLGIDYVVHQPIAFVDKPGWIHEPRLAVVSPDWYYVNHLHSSTPIPSGMAFSMRLLRQAGFYREELRFLGDWELSHRLLFNVAKRQKMIGYLSGGHVAWRVHRNSISGSLWKDHFVEHEGYIDSTFYDDDYPQKFSLRPDVQVDFIQRAIAYRYARLLDDFTSLPPRIAIRQSATFLRCFFSQKSLQQRQKNLRLFPNGLRPAFQCIGKSFRWVANTLMKCVAGNGGEQATATAATAEPGSYEAGHVALFNHGTRQAVVAQRFHGHLPAPEQILIVAEYDRPELLKRCRKLIRDCDVVRILDLDCGGFFEEILTRTLEYRNDNAQVIVELSNTNPRWVARVKVLIDKCIPGSFSRIRTQAANPNQTILELCGDSESERDTPTAVTARTAGRPERHLPTDAETAIVMQGTLNLENDYTYDVLSRYVSQCPECSAILSTWENEDAETLQRIEDLGVKVVLSQPPKTSGPLHLNDQMRSTKTGMSAAEQLGATFALKTRTDTRINTPKGVGHLQALWYSFPTNSSAKQRGRILCLDYATRLYLPFHPSDMLMFGHIDDLVRYWSSPEFEQTGYSEPDVINFNALLRLPIPEIYLCRSYLDSIFYSYETTIQSWWDTLRDLFLVVNRSALDFHWTKASLVAHELMKMDAVRKTKNLGRVGAKRNMDLCTFGDWLNIAVLGDQCRLTLEQLKHDRWDAIIEDQQTIVRDEIALG